MITTSLDKIVRSVLLRKRYSLHYYLDFLLAATNCLRNITIDDLKIVTTKKFTVDGSNVVSLTGNVADVVGVYSYFVYGNSRIYGGGYKLNLINNQIEFEAAYNGVDVVVSYIDDGRNADASSHVHAYAEETIEAYILWQNAEMSRSYSANERLILKSEYIREREILRARMSDLDLLTLRIIANRLPRNKTGLSSTMVSDASGILVSQKSSSNIVVLPTGMDNYIVPAGTFIDIVLVIDAVNTVVSVGSSQGATDLADAVTMVGTYVNIEINTYFPTSRRIWFNGVSSNSIIRIYIR